MSEVEGRTPAVHEVVTKAATIIRCADLVRHVYSTLESVERQTSGPGEIVLVTDESTPEPALEWLTQLARTRGLLLAHARSARPGAVRNTGVRATRSPYVMCVDAGDLLDPRFHQMAAAKLDEDSQVDFVTSWIQVLGPGAGRRVIASAGCDLGAVIGSSDAVHGASMFRRDAWIALDGFDESLPSQDDYDFWLRVLASGGRQGAMIERPLLIRGLREDALYRRAWAREPHIDAMTRLTHKHAALFGRDAAQALCTRERLLQELAETYRRVVARRDAGLQELEALTTRAGALRESLPASERDGVDLADLRRTTPIARDWGYERGKPIDRRYIERFLQEHAADIRGAVLEVQEPDYTKQFGGSRVTRSDVIDLDPSNPRANVMSDLRSAANVPADTYDCIILTQTLHVIGDMQAAASECARILRPGGVLLVTLPCASRVCLEYGHDGDFWRVTEAGARRLFSQIFPTDALEVKAYGNVLANAAFLYGLGCHELTETEFDVVDPYFPLLVGVRAMKPPVAARPPTRHPSDRAAGAAILLYHRVSDPESDVHSLSITPQEFRAHVKHMREHCHPMPLDELVAAARDGCVPPGAVAVTFDDGYIDNYTAASPILSAFDVPATFFVTTDRLGEDNEFWWDTLERSLLSSGSALPSELRIDLPDGARTFATGSVEQRLTTHWHIYRAIVGSPADARDEVIRALMRWSGRTAVANSLNRRMRPDEIVALAARQGHVIGAHSARHLMLPRQPVALQREEVEQSRRALESLLERSVPAFAYPFGAFSDETVEVVRDASFEVAVTCEDSPLSCAVDPLRLPRIEVTRGHAAHFGDWLHRQLARHA